MSQSPGPFELSAALSQMVDNIDQWLRAGGYSGDPIDMFLAGGMALHLHCGVRYTEDVDASFSKRMLVPANEMMVDYTRNDGVNATLYFDANYNDTFALMHPDYRESSIVWPDINRDDRLVRLRVLTPIDLAVSKISRYSDQDEQDILTLANEGLFSAEQLRAHAEEALDYYVGNLDTIRLKIDQICKQIS